MITIVQIIKKVKNLLWILPLYIILGLLFSNINANKNNKVSNNVPANKKIASTLKIANINNIREQNNLLQDDDTDESKAYTVNYMLDNNASNQYKKQEIPMNKYIKGSDTTKSKATTQYLYANNIEINVGYAKLQNTSSYIDDEYFAQKISLHKNNGYVIAGSYSRESFKNFFTQISLGMTNIKYKISNTNIDANNPLILNNNYININNYDIVINYYYNINLHNLINKYTGINNAVVNTIIKNTNPYLGLGLGIEIIDAEYFHNKNSNINYSIPKANYYSYLVNIISGVKYSITAKHYINLAYHYNIKSKDVLVNEFKRYNTQNILIGYGYRF